MSDTPAQETTRTRRLGIALSGLALALTSPIAWALTLDDSFLRRTGLLMWFVMAVGLVVSTWAALGDSRRRTRIVAAGTVLWVPLAISAFLAFTKLPAPENRDLKGITDFTLPDHLGQPVTLSELLTESPVLLVFYRGHW